MEGTTTRFRQPKTAEGERILIESTVPKNTENNTKWAVKLFREWQSNRDDKFPKPLHSSSIRLDMEKVQQLSSPLEDMNAETLNWWLSRFIEEASNRRGERYPPKTLYLLACGIKRYLSDKSGLDPFARGDQRFVLFRKIIDGEMRDATKCGVDLKSKKEAREEITIEEENIFWEKELLGQTSAECLLNTIYFYCGKLFGLRGNEQRLLRISNIILQGNLIVFDESISKTFHGGLKDLKRNSRLVKHMCHDFGQTHSPCLQNMFKLYLDKIKDFAESIEAFYFRPARDGSFCYEKSPVGINTLNKILPDKLCGKAGIKRKTSHCLRITCASRLFQHGVNEKQTRERTGHRSDSLFRYQKPSLDQMKHVSNVLAPPVATTSSPMTESKNEDCLAIVDSLFDDGISDELFSNLDIPECSTNQNSSNIVSPVFNSCTVNFWMK